MEKSRGAQETRDCWGVNTSICHDGLNDVRLRRFLPRVHIAKGDGKKTRPIDIPTFPDTVLQRGVASYLVATTGLLDVVTFGWLW